MRPDRFPVEVAERLKWYVYRLIDPRNGETFYVGKGKGDRLFQHAKGALTASEDEDRADLKYQRIKDIIPRLCGNPKKSLANQFCRDSDPFHDPRRLS
jgi:hypothetical protein